MMDKTVINDLNDFLAITRIAHRKLGDTKFFVYALKCEDGSIYIGKTNSPIRRLIEHFNGKTSQTRKIKPCDVIYLEGFSAESESLQAERRIMKILNPELFNEMFMNRKWSPERRKRKVDDI